MQYFPLINHTLLEDFSLNGGWISLKANSNLAKEQNDYKFGTLKYDNGLSDLALFQGWETVTAVRKNKI